MAAIAEDREQTTLIPSLNMLWPTIGVGLLFWGADACIDAYLFEEGTLVRQLVAPTAVELWMRIVVVSLLVGFGLYAQVLIRQRDHALQQVIASEGKYQDLYNHAPDMFTSVEARTGKILRCNQTLANATGYSKDEIVGRHISEMYHPDCIDEFYKTFRQFVQTGAVRDAELQLRRKDGGKIDVSMNVSAVRDEQGKILYSRSIWRDITKRRQVEQALREREEQLLQILEEREAISQDLHDGILQSLYGVGLQLESFKAHVPEGSRNAQQQIDEVIRQLNALIGEVRDYITGLGSNIFAAVDFRTGVEQLTSTLSRTSPVQVQLNIDPSAASHLTRSQATQFLFILNECLSNTVRHAHAQRVTVNLNREDSLVSFEVQDDGVGFDAGALHSRGHGLRNMARRAQKVGGRFNTSSKPGQGSRIQVALPVPAQHGSLPT